MVMAAEAGAANATPSTVAAAMATALSEDATAKRRRNLRGFMMSGFSLLVIFACCFGQSEECWVLCVSAARCWGAFPPAAADLAYVVCLAWLPRRPAGAGAGDADDCEA